jgi:DNA-binding transcriptional ArsR family regulator
VDAALKALAEPRRRAILRLVWSQELPATGIADRFPDVTRPAISQHLSVLKEADLVTERREGTRRLYRANAATVADLRAFLDDYWTSGLERLRDAAEAAEGRHRRAAAPAPVPARMSPAAHPAPTTPPTAPVRRTPGTAPSHDRGTGTPAPAPAAAHRPHRRKAGPDG